MDMEWKKLSFYGAMGRKDDHVITRVASGAGKMHICQTWFSSSKSQFHFIFILSGL